MTHRIYGLLPRAAMAGAVAAFAPLATAAVSDPVDLGTVVHGYQDDFSNPATLSNYTVKGQNIWTVTDGLLHAANGSGGTDPNKLLYSGATYRDGTNGQQEVLARMRVTSVGATPLDDNRGGLATASEATVGNGINYLFKDRLDGVAGNPTRNTTELLNDQIAWGPENGSFLWTPNQFYWVRLTTLNNASGNDATAKIWADDGVATEAGAATVSWNYTDAAGSFRSGLAGVQGPSRNGQMTLDVDYLLVKASDLPAITASVPEPAGLSLLALGALPVLARRRRRGA